MKTLLKITLLLTMVLAISGCKITSVSEGQDKSVRVCRNTTKTILNSYAELKIPDNLKSDHPIRKETDFRLASVVEKLDFVKVNERFQVDYVYSYRNSMGFPLVYSLPASEKRFENEDDYKKGKSMAFTYALETDFSQWGFLQLAILEELGGQFYQYYQAEYDDVTVICDIDDVENLIDVLDSEGVHPAFNWWQKMRALTISETDPIIYLDQAGGSAVVSMLVFDHELGILRRDYTYTYGFPHKLLKTEDKLIVGYSSQPSESK